MATTARAAFAPTIMVVEDNAAAREMINSVLGAVGYCVTFASCGKDAIGLLQGSRPAAVLLDLHLPDMHGVDVLKAIRRDGGLSNLPIIVLTGSGKIDDVAAATASGANDYMMKPFQPSTLLQKIEKYTGHLARSARSAPAH